MIHTEQVRGTEHHRNAAVRGHEVAGRTVLAVSRVETDMEDCGQPVSVWVIVAQDDQPEAEVGEQIIIEGRPIGLGEVLPEACTNCLSQVNVDWPASTWYPPIGHKIRADGSIECPSERIITISLDRLADHVDTLLERDERSAMFVHAPTRDAVRAAITGWEG